jgi:hypothetical protein
LTAIFAANHRAIFPATALVAWAVLAYFCVDFGYWSKLFPVDAEHVAVYRAAAEAGVAASLVLFLYCFLRIGLWHGWIKTLFWCWIAAQFALVVLAIIDPRLASGLARSSLHGRHRRDRHMPDRLFLALRRARIARFCSSKLDALVVWLFGAAMIVARQAVRRRRGDRTLPPPSSHPRCFSAFTRCHQFAFRSTGGPSTSSGR